MLGLRNHCAAEIRGQVAGRWKSMARQEAGQRPGREALECGGRGIREASTRIYGLAWRNDQTAVGAGHDIVAGAIAFLHRN